MDFLPDEKYKKIIYVAIYAVIAGAAVWLFFRYVLGVVLPFILGWLVAAALQRPTVFLHKKTKIPKMALSVFFVVLILGITTLIIVAIIFAVIRNGGNIITKITAHRDKIGASLKTLFEKIGAFAEKFGIDYDGGIPDFLQNAITSAASSLTSFFTGAAARFAAALPRALIFFAALVMSSIYFCAGYRSIADFILKKLPSRISSGVSAFKREFGAAMIKYLRSYSLIFLLTFGELFLGFSVIGIEGAVVFAALVALVDILPVLGAGAVLVPWAIIEFILGNTALGVSLAVLQVIIAIVRQIVEPRIVGRGIGLHPVVSLMSMYVGLRVFGILGMIGAPLFFVIVKNTFVAIRGRGTSEG